MMKMHLYTGHIKYVVILQLILFQEATFHLARRDERTFVPFNQLFPGRTFKRNGIEAASTTKGTDPAAQKGSGSSRLVGIQFSRNLVSSGGIIPHMDIGTVGNRGKKSTAVKKGNNHWYFQLRTNQPFSGNRYPMFSVLMKRLSQRRPTN